MVCCLWGFLRRLDPYQTFTLEIGNEQKLEMLLVKQVRGSVLTKCGKVSAPFIPL